MDDKIRAALEGCVTYREIYRYYKLTGLIFPGNNINEHLSGCDGVIFAVITLGAGVDAALRREQLRDLPYALMLDLAASDLIEEYQTDLLQRLKTEYEAQGRFITGAYSPGYGDLTLSYQRELLRLAGAQAIGVMLSESLIMTPRKSISGIIGVADKPVTGKPAGCDNCDMAKSCTRQKCMRGNYV